MVRLVVVVVVMVVVVSGQSGGVRDGHGGRRGRRRGAGKRVHGVVGGVRFERTVVRRVMVVFGLRDDIHRRQSFSAGQQTLIQAAEYIALQLQIECTHNCQQGILLTPHSRFKTFPEKKKSYQKKREHTKQDTCNIPGHKN